MKKAYSLVAVASLAVAVAFSASVASAAAMYTRNLTIGSTGADVASLQTTLVSEGHLVIPAGVAKGYFGSLTKAALAKWQAANGVAPAAGYFGPITMAKFNAMGDSGSEGGSSGGPDDGLQGGEGNIKDFDILGNPGNETLDEGETDQVLGFEFEADDSDLRVERVEVRASSTAASTSEKPWKYFESAALYHGSEKVAEVDNLDDEDAWDEESVNDTYSFRFSNVDSVVEEGDTDKFYVEVTAQDSLDTSDTPGVFDLGLTDNGMRVVDAEGIDHEEGDEDDSNTVTFDDADAGDLELSIDDDDNKDRTVFVDEDSDTEGVEILRFTLESNSSDNMVDELAVAIASTTNDDVNGGATISEVIKSLTLEVDGEEVGSESMSSGAGTSTATFDDLGIEIAEDDEVEVVVLADIESQEDNYIEGFEFHASVATTSIDAEDAEGDDVSFGTQANVFGGDIELRTEGVQIDFVSSSATRTNGSILGDPDSVEFKINFKVTSSGEDIYLDGDTTLATTSGSYYSDGINWSTSTDSTSTSTNPAPASTTPAAILTASDGYKSSDTNSSGNKIFKISKGNSRNFTMTVTLVPSGDNQALGIQINSLKWGTVNTSDNFSNLYNIDLEDFRTDVVTGLFIR